MKRPQKKKDPSSQSALSKMAELRKWEMNTLQNSLKGRPKSKMDDDEQVLFTRWELLKSQDPLVNAIQDEDIIAVKRFFKAQERIPSDSLGDILFASIEDGREDLVVEILKSKHPIHPQLLKEAHQFAISLGQIKIAHLIQTIR